MVLYTPAILALSVELAGFPLNESFQCLGMARSRLCGSTIEFGCNSDSNGRIKSVGAKVSACAIGQASAALFLRSAAGRDLMAIEIAKEDLAAWLTDNGPRPDWPDIGELDAARAYPARHPVILLPWMAAVDALSLDVRAG
ncbi:MAG: iron-sulfur cluster assembly scaffold protein [Sphingomonadaceae bacterium]